MSLATKIRGFREVWAFDNRLWLTVTKTFFRREKLHVYRFKGLDILVDHAAGDANGAREVLTSPMYSRFLPKMDLNRPINILDVGGSNGGFPLLLAASGYQIKKVVSVELNPRTFVRLQFNLCRNLECDVTAINAAVCGENRALNVLLGQGGVSDSIVSDATEVRNGKEYEIAGITFDELYTRNFGSEIVDICKIDVEGSEFEIMSSPFQTRLASCRYLIMEIHEGEGRKKVEIIPILEAMGFESQPLEPGADTNVHFFINLELEKAN